VRDNTCTSAVIINGIRKCNVKNRVSVALSTANPPHTHWTSSVPFLISLISSINYSGTFFVYKTVHTVTNSASTFPKTS
jgi:hypothetical protein